MSRNSLHHHHNHHHRHSSSVMTYFTRWIYKHGRLVQVILGILIVLASLQRLSFHHTINSNFHMDWNLEPPQLREFVHQSSSSMPGKRARQQFNTTTKDHQTDDDENDSTNGYTNSTFNVTQLLLEWSTMIRPMEFYDKTMTVEEFNTPISNDPILVHSIKTRFMQRQSKLVALGQARLLLFRVFCLPSMIRQSNHNFVWIIRTDPKLPPSLLQPLQALLRPYSNRFFLLLDNHNEHNLRDMDLTEVVVASGNVSSLQHAIDMAKVRPSLETRLDADDGINQYFVDHIQAKGIASTYVSSKYHWRVFCARKTILWNTGTLVDSSKKKQRKFGTLELELSKRFCITPGLTYLLPPNVTQLPEKGHQKLKLETAKCPEVTPTIASTISNYYNKNYNKDQLKLVHVNSTAHDTILAQQQQQQHAATTTTTFSTRSLHNTSDTTIYSNGTIYFQSIPIPTVLYNHCLDILHFDWPQVVRARTPTSHGMIGVTSPKRRNEDSESQALLWKTLEREFGIVPKDALHVMEQFRRNLNAIAVDNVHGQCTPGHSCKKNVKEELQWIAKHTEGQDNKKI